MTGTELAQAFTGILEEGSRFVGSLDDATYTFVHPSAAGSSIGGHFRHVVDHYTRLVEGVQLGIVDYDARERDPRIEQDRAFACETVRKLLPTCEALSERGPSSTLLVACAIDPDGDAARVESSLGREMVFVVSHAVHHYAIMAMMGRTLGVAVPSGFGYAPSTLKYLCGAAGRG